MTIVATIDDVTIERLGALGAEELYVFAKHKGRNYTAKLATALDCGELHSPSSGMGEGKFYKLDPTTLAKIGDWADRYLIAQILREGVGDDIWYDAHDYGDDAAAERIERIQQAMSDAADLLDPPTPSGGA